MDHVDHRRGRRQAGRGRSNGSCSRRARCERSTQGARGGRCGQALARDLRDIARECHRWSRLSVDAASASRRLDQRRPSPPARAEGGSGAVRDRSAAAPMRSRRSSSASSCIAASASAFRVVWIAQESCNSVRDVVLERADAGADHRAALPHAFEYGHPEASTASLLQDDRGPALQRVEQRGGLLRIISGKHR